MPRLQHRVRRDGGVTVGSTRYELDASGCVDVSEEHAELLSQGAMWAPEGSWGDIAEKAKPPEMISGGIGRRPRTQEELRAAAEVEGVALPSPEPEPVESKPKPTPVVRRRRKK